MTAWFHVKERLRVDQVHVAPVAGGNGESFLMPVTDMLTPANGAKLSGPTFLLATATSYFSVTKVEFYLTGGSNTTR